MHDLPGILYVNPEAPIGKARIWNGANPRVLCLDEKQTHRIFLCNICDQVFRQKKSMLDHRMSIHEGVKYQCERCPKKFAWKTGLDNHIRDKHLFKYKMQCSKCNKTFVSKKGLDYHLRISCEEKTSVDKPFDCDNCEQKFASGDSLWHHKNTFHNGKRYNCTKCNATGNFCTVQFCRSISKPNMIRLIILAWFVKRSLLIKAD